MTLFESFLYFRIKYIPGREAPRSLLLSGLGIGLLHCKVASLFLPIANLDYLNWPTS